jgi:hypothetical protein
MLGRPSGPADPIPRSALEIHDREYSQFVSSNRVEEPIGKALAESTPDSAKDDRT